MYSTVLNGSSSFCMMEIGQHAVRFFVYKSRIPRIVTWDSLLRELALPDVPSEVRRRRRLLLTIHHRDIVLYSSVLYQ